MIKILFVMLVAVTLTAGSLYAQDSSSEVYIVEKRDTLWGISDARLEDPFLWPKLWNVNPHIENPDLIYPGTRVLIPSREELMKIPAVPQKRYVKTKKRKISKPKTLFQSKPRHQRGKQIIDNNLYISSGWIADSYPSIGTVSSAVSSRRIVGKNDLVYIQLNEQVKPGDRFFAIRNVKKVNHPADGHLIGHQIRVTGILEVVPSEDRAIKARVTNSFEDTLVGDGLMHYIELEAPLSPKTARTPEMDGYIIESHMNTSILGSGQVVFLDKGESDGLQVGDIFSVFINEPVLKPIGKIQVVSLQSSTSGAVILESGQEISIGRKWGQ